MERLKRKSEHWCAMCGAYQSHDPYQWHFEGVDIADFEDRQPATSTDSFRSQLPPGGAAGAQFIDIDLAHAIQAQHRPDAGEARLVSAISLRSRARWCAECGGYVNHDAVDYHREPVLDRTSVQPAKRADSLVASRTAILRRIWTVILAHCVHSAVSLRLVGSTRAAKD